MHLVHRMHLFFYVHKNILDYPQTINTLQYIMASYVKIPPQAVSLGKIFINRWKLTFCGKIVEVKTQLGVKYPPERLMDKIYSLVIVQKVTTDNF